MIVLTLKWQNSFINLPNTNHNHVHAAFILNNIKVFNSGRKAANQKLFRTFAYY